MLPTVKRKKNLIFALGCSIQILRYAHMTVSEGFVLLRVRLNSSRPHTGDNFILIFNIHDALW